MSGSPDWRPGERASFLTYSVCICLSQLHPLALSLAGGETVLRLTASMWIKGLGGRERFQRKLGAQADCRPQLAIFRLRGLVLWVVDRYLNILLICRGEPQVVKWEIWTVIQDPGQDLKNVRETVELIMDWFTLLGAGGMVSRELPEIRMILSPQCSLSRLIRYNQSIFWDESREG